MRSDGFSNGYQSRMCSPIDTKVGWVLQWIPRSDGSPIDWASNTEPMTLGLFSNGIGIKHGK